MNILIVDDDPQFAQGLRGQLEKMGHQAVVALDGRLGLEAFLQGKFSVVLVDALLPKLSGEELVREILKTKRGTATAVALVSGIFKQKSAQQELQKKSGAQAFLSKPLSEERLSAFLASVKISDTGSTAAVSFSVFPGQTTTSNLLSTSELDSLLAAGNLGGMSPLKIIWFLHRFKKTGILQFVGDAKQLSIHFIDGLIGHMDSNDNRSLFGQLLVSQGYLNEAELTRVMSMTGTGKRLGTLLVEQALISPHVIEEMFYHQQFERLGVLAESSVQAFTFSQKQPTASLPYAFTLFDVLHELVFRRLPYAYLKQWVKRLADFQMIPVREAQLMKQWKRSAEDQAVIQSLSQPVLVRAWLKSASKAEEHALRLLYFLDVLDVVRFKHPQQAEMLQNETDVFTRDFEEMNFFERLGVTRDTNVAHVRERFRTLSKEYHPDMTPKDATPQMIASRKRIFELIVEAHDALKDEAALQRYRRFGKLVAGTDVMVAEREFANGKRAFLRKNYGVARQHFERATEINPEDGIYLAYLSWAELYLLDRSSPEFSKKVPAIQARIAQAQRLSPNDSTACLVLGTVFKMMGQRDRAEAAFRDALDIDPENRDAQRELRLMTMRDVEQGKKDFKIFGIKIK